MLSKVHRRPSSTGHPVSCCGDARLQPMVFDLRQDPISPSNSASVRVVQQFYIGDSCESMFLFVVCELLWKLMKVLGMICKTF